MAHPSLRALASALAGIVTLAVIGCTPSEPLEERAVKYWKARQERDAAVAYRLEHPDIRGPESEYVTRIASGPLIVHGAEVEKVEIEDGDRARVTMRIEYRHPLMPRNLKVPIVDEWEKVNGQWLHKTPPMEFHTGSALDAARARPRAPGDSQP
jgi:hypothetical protein